ncbi:MAG: hypothetical protein CSA15_11180 [Candidatus Delongbacteria bacterium]|nr:MAG: hypothetical protein CSA15_11180 [Candidatus Delongbacteria bacterium]
MENSFKKITNSKFVIIWVSLISIGIFIGSIFIANPISNILINDYGIDFNTKQSIFKITILIISVISMLILNKGNLKEFGFKKPKPISYFKLTWLTAVVVIPSIIISAVLFLGVMDTLFPQKGLNKIIPEKNFLTTIVTIWFLSSFSETILTRGLFQSMLKNLKQIKFMRLSLPVILTGIFFGLLHTSLFFAGKSIWFTAFIVSFTTSTGVLAAYYREKSDSIIPAFLVHLLANIIGAIPLILKMLR